MYRNRSHLTGSIKSKSVVEISNRGIESEREGEGQRETGRKTSTCMVTKSTEERKENNILLNEIG